MAGSSYLLDRRGVPARWREGLACQTERVAMETKRWFNPSQPQTLQIAVWLLYFNAVGGLLLGSFFFALGPIVGLASLVGCGAAAFGIANEKRWGYFLGVAMAVLDVLLIVAAAGGIIGRLPRHGARSRSSSPSPWSRSCCTR